MPKTATATPNESNRDRFLRVGKEKGIGAVKAIRRMKGLGRPASYEYTEADIERIEKTLHNEVDSLVDSLKLALKGGQTASDIEFPLG